MDAVTATEEAALRAIYAACARIQIHLAQRPGIDVVAVMRESQHAVSCLQLVAEFLSRDDVPDADR